MTGPLGEVRIADRTGTNTSSSTARERDLRHRLIRRSSMFRQRRVPPRGDEQGTAYSGVNNTTTTSMDLDSTRADYLPPSLTTMMMLDGTGVIATRLEPHGSGSLLFSAADFAPDGSSRAYQPLRGDATVVSYRYAGETAWRPLTATQVTESAARAPASFIASTSQALRTSPADWST